MSPTLPENVNIQEKLSLDNNTRIPGVMYQQRHCVGIRTFKLLL